MYFGDLCIRTEDEESYIEAFNVIERFCPGFKVSIYVVADCYCFRRRYYGDRELIHTQERVKTVFTDGLPQYPTIIVSCFPGAEHLRCRWHLEQQVRRALTSLLGVYYSTMWKDFKAVMYNPDPLSHGGLLAILVQGILTDGPSHNGRRERAAMYITTLFAEFEQTFCEAWVRLALTFGMRSTQRSESLNSAIKNQISSYQYLGAFLFAGGHVRKEQAKVLATGLQTQDAALGGVSRLPATRWYGRVSRYMGDLFQVQVDLSGVTSTAPYFEVTVVEVDTEQGGARDLERHSFRVQRAVRVLDVIPNVYNIVLFIDPKVRQPSVLSVVGGECDCSTYMGWMMQCRHLTTCLSRLGLFVVGNVDLAINLFHPRWQLSNVRLLRDRIWTELHEQGGHHLPPQTPPPTNHNIRVSSATSGGVHESLVRQQGTIRAMADSVVVVFDKLTVENRTSLLRQMSGLLSVFTPLTILDIPINETTGEASEPDEMVDKGPVDKPEQRAGSGRVGVSTSGPGAGGGAIHNPAPKPREKKGRPASARSIPGDARATREPRLKKTKRVCTNCRVGGHLGPNCPHPCGKCGSSDHKRKFCPTTKRRIPTNPGPNNPDPVPPSAGGADRSARPLTGLPSDDEDLDDDEVQEGLASLLSADDEEEEEGQGDVNNQTGGGDGGGGGGRPLSRRGGRGFSS